MEEGFFETAGSLCGGNGVLMRITKEIALEGINRARCPRACRYTDEKGTCCVAAQILELIGVRIPKLNEPYNEVDVTATYVFGKTHNDLLSYEEVIFLRPLQMIWDGNTPSSTRQETEEELKEIMRSYVNEYFDQKAS